MKPLLSIIIPTKNRYNSLIPVIDALLKYIKEPDYEIIIQDNSDSNEIIKQKLHQINDSRIRYFYSSQNLSVSENSDLAVKNSCSEYLTMIGDDDLVSPYIVQIVRLMVEQGIESLVYQKGNYYWNDLKFVKQYAFNYPGSLQFSKNLSLVVKKLSTNAELSRVLENGGCYMFNLPCLYHGIVKRSVMEQVRNKFGKYIPGSSPDMAVAIAISTILNEYCIINYPVSITGASVNSAAGLGVINKHISKIEDVKWLPKNILNNWDLNIPRYWTGPTIYAQTIFEVLTQSKRNFQINYRYLYYTMLIYNNQISGIIKQNFFRLYGHKLVNYFFLLKSYLIFSLKKAVWSSPAFVLNALIFFRGDFIKKRLIRNVKNVDECMSHLATETNIFYNEI